MSFLGLGIALLALASGPLDEGWRLLDAGRNAAAAEHFGALHARSPSAATAQGLAEALRRQCRLRDEFERVAFDPVDPYVAALDRATRDRPDEAVPLYLRAAREALAARDSAAAAAAALDGAEVALRAGHFAVADTLSELAVVLGSAARDRRVELTGRVRQADRLNFAGRFAAADSAYDAVGTRAEAAGLTAIACDAANGRGAVASRQRRVDVSRRHYLRALRLARDLGDARRRIRILANVAYDHTQARDTDAARRVLAEAFALADSCDFESMRGHLHTTLAAAHETDGDRDAAVAQFRRSVRIFTSQGDEGGELGARQRLAYNLMMSGRYAEAIANYEACLEIIDRRDSPHILNWVLAGLALTHHKLGNLERAEHFYRRAIDQNEAFGDRMSVAWCVRSLGVLALLRGQYGQALARYHEALEISRSIGDQEGVGETHVALAGARFFLGDWDQARDHYEQAVDIARTYDLEELLRGAVAGLAALGTATGRPELARRHCESALALARRWRDATARIWARMELAELDLETGDRAAARRHLAAADSLLLPAGQYVLRSRTLLLRARCTDRPDSAVALATAALEQAELGGLPEREWACLTARGTWRLALGDTVGALADQAAAVRIVESLRRNVGHDELRRHMLRPALPPYERAIDLLAGGTMPDGAREALVYAERSRAQILAARLRDALAGRADTDADALTPGRNVLASIIHHQSRLQDASLPEPERARIRRRVAELETEYMVLRLGAERHGAGPAVFATVPPRAEDLPEVLHADEQAAVFFLGGERSWLFAVTAGEVAAHPLPPRAEIEDLVRRYLALREASDASVDRLAAASRRLHELLLAPLGDDPTPVLVVVPDGLLHRLPLGALADERGPLAARRQVFIAPSLQTLAYLRQREAERRRSARSPAVAVAVGHAGSDGDERLHPYAGRPFAPLVHAEAEAHAVARLFRRAEVLTGARATESALAAAPLDRAGLLHLAAHGDVDDRQLRRSFVLLEQDDPAGGDGLLQWDEAATLDLGASLVTLASCRSARGVLAAGEGVTGLTQAFLFAGATCVLAAQADIADGYAHAFMRDFYRHLRAGETAAAALRRVQLAAAARDPHSTHWADFVLVGDGAVTLPPDLLAGGGNRARIVAVAAAAVAAAAALVIVGRRRYRKPVSSTDGGSPTG